MFAVMHGAMPLNLKLAKPFHAKLSVLPRPPQRPSHVTARVNRAMGRVTGTAIAARSFSSISALLPDVSPQKVHMLHL